MWHTRRMNTPPAPNPSKRHRFPVDIISHACGCTWGSRSTGTKNVDPLQPIGFIDLHRTHSNYLYTCKANSRGCGRKPVSWIQFNDNRRKNQMCWSTMDVDKDHRFPPRFHPSPHGSLFPVRLRREPQHPLPLNPMACGTYSQTPREGVIH